MKWFKDATFYFNKVGTGLEKLTNEEIKTILLAYYDGDSATSLIEKYDLDISPQALYKQFPPIVTKHECVYDENRMVVNLPGKSSNDDYYWSNPDCYCSHCGHKYQGMCACDNCKEVAALEKDAKIEMIRSTYSRNKKQLLELDDLSLKDRLYLSSYIRGFMSENLLYLHSLSSSKGKLTPSHEADVELVRHLIRNGVMNPHPNSDISCFPEDDESGEFPEVYYTNHVNYQLLIEPESNYEELINDLMYLDKEEFLEDKGYCLELWREVALLECEEFLLYRMNAVGFEFTPGKKTNQVLLKLLDNFSVGQICNLIYSRVAGALQWHTEKRIPKQQAANSVISNLERSGEKALVENWSVRGYTRNWELPQSQLSHVLYNTILGISERGFMEVPTANFD